MSAEADISEPVFWSPAKFWTTIGCVFALQVGLIFWLGNRSAASPHPAPGPPRAGLAHKPNEGLALLAPTLSARPHPDGRAGGPATPTREFHPADWSEPPLWLALPLPQLGAAFRDFVQT